MKIISFVLIMFILAGCAYQRINLFNVRKEMSLSEVAEALNRSPDNLIGTKQYDDGIVEVLQYSRYEVWNNQLIERYWLYFFNNKLVQWTIPGDWQKEADRTYEIRNQ